MGQEAARKTNIILREVVKNGYLAVRLTVRVNQCDQFFIWAHFCKNSGGIRAGYKQKSGQKQGTF